MVISLVVGRRTQYNALKERPTSWDPYGVSQLGMTDLLLGQKIINLQIPVHNCSIPDLLGRKDDTGKVGLPFVLALGHQLKTRRQLSIVKSFSAIGRDNSNIEI